MTTTPSSPSATVAVAPRQRDIRLDFFRGIGMFIIFIAHVPYNAWVEFIPARIGFSDATEIFVFCSGMASAIAFGKLYEERGFLLGTTRISYRCWQVYWAHISVFLLVTATMVLADKWLETGGAYVKGLNVHHFLEGDTGTNLVGLLTLTYVPNLHDILPMYLVILAMLPVVMALYKLGRIYVFAAMIIVWLFATTGMINLPAEPWTDRQWYFNPFAWQLIFFTGFAFMRGWIPAPVIDRRLMIAATVFLVVTIPFAHHLLLANFEIFANGRALLEPLLTKTGFGVLRFAHFLCVAYLAYALAGPAGENLRALKGPVVRICCKVGQQALGVFLAGQFLSMIGGIYLNELGHTFFNTAVVNIVGCALLVGVAYLVAYYKSAPWSRKPIPAAEYATAQGSAEQRSGSRPAGSNRTAGQPAE
ncbi:MAG: OpgC domain-containing protein [Filomicrobium sp.]